MQPPITMASVPYDTEADPKVAKGRETGTLAKAGTIGWDPTKTCGQLAYSGGEACAWDNAGQLVWPLRQGVRP